MPIPFRDQSDIDALGAAAYLTVQSADGEQRAALFLISARGAPLHFCWNRARFRRTSLWRKEDLTREASRRLAASLLSACPRVPALLLCLSSEVGEELFGRELRLDLPLGRISVAESGSGEVTWQTAPPAEGSPSFRLWVRLAATGLLTEPFARAKAGLAEVLASEKRDSSPGVRGQPPERERT